MKISCSNTNNNRLVQTTMNDKDKSCAIDIAISDMIHSLGLPFHFVEDIKFRRFFNWLSWFIQSINLLGEVQLEEKTTTKKLQYCAI